jgi:hypothetical protein
LAVPDGFSSVLIGERGIPKRAAAAFELPSPDSRPTGIGGMIPQGSAAARCSRRFYFRVILVCPSYCPTRKNLSMRNSPSSIRSRATV